MPPAWPQNYDPTGAWPLSTLLAALSVVILFAVLVGLRRAVWQAALAGLVAALALAWLAFGMPAPLVGAAAAHGVVFGLFRIAWIIVTSMFLYEVACATGQFEIMKASIAGLASDRRLQLACCTRSSGRCWAGWVSPSPAPTPDPTPCSATCRR